MGRGFVLDMYIVEVANEEVVKLVEEVAKVAKVIVGFPARGKEFSSRLRSPSIRFR